MALHSTEQTSFGVGLDWEGSGVLPKGDSLQACTAPDHHHQCFRAAVSCQKLRLACQAKEASRPDGAHAG